MQISFNITPGLVSAKQANFSNATSLQKFGSLSNLNLKDLDGSEIRIPDQDFKGNISQKIAESYSRIEYHNEISGQSYQTLGRRYDMACPSELRYSTNGSPLLTENLELFQTTNSIIYSKPCSSPSLYIIRYIFNVLNGYCDVFECGKNIPNDQITDMTYINIMNEVNERKASIYAQFNKLLENTTTRIVDIDYGDSCTRIVTYKSSSERISCMDMTLNLRSIVGPGENPLEPLLRKAWPPIMAGKAPLIIPRQKLNSKTFSPDLDVALVIETLSFQLPGMEKYFGAYDTLGSTS